MKDSILPKQFSRSLWRRPIVYILNISVGLRLPARRGRRLAPEYIAPRRSRLLILIQRLLLAIRRPTGIPANVTPSRSFTTSSTTK